MLDFRIWSCVFIHHSRRSLVQVLISDKMCLWNLLSLYEQSCCGTAVKTSDKIFDGLIASIKMKHILVNQLMQSQEKTAVIQAKQLQLQLEDEITKLRRRDSELEQLSHVDDDIHFIQVPERNCTGRVWISFLSLIHIFTKIQRSLHKMSPKWVQIGMSVIWGCITL